MVPGTKSKKSIFWYQVPSVLALAVCLFLFSGCVHEHFVTTSDSVRLAYDFRHADRQRGTAILLHGLGSDYNEWDALTNFLNQNGWSTIAFDFRGHGASTDWRRGDLDWRSFTAAARVTMLKDIETVYGLVDYGHRHPVWLIGSSIGANLAVSYAADHPEIDGIILLSPGYNYGGIESRQAMNRYGRRPVLIAGSAEDPGGVLQNCEILYQEAAGSKKILKYEEAGHGSAMIDYDKELKGEILKWLNQNTR